MKVMIPADFALTIYILVICFLNLAGVWDFTSNSTSLWVSGVVVAAYSVRGWARK